MKIAVVVSEFNKKISERLLAGAEKALRENKIPYDVFWAPGAFEIPYMAQKLLKTKKYNGLIALGCVLKGETDHYRAVCDGVTFGIQKVSLQYGAPIMFGVLMCNTEKQALARSQENTKRNKGYECAKELFKLLKKFQQTIYKK